MAKDKKESELMAFNDCEWIRALDNAGNSIKINKADLVKLLKEEIPTFGYFQLEPNHNRWTRVLNMDFSDKGECFSSFLFSGGSFTNTEACCLIINIMYGALTQVTVNRISGTEFRGQVNVSYQFNGTNLKIWIQGIYAASGGALINLSSIYLPFENKREVPCSDAIQVIIR